MENQVTIREELARKDAELSSIGREKERIQSELAQARSTHTELRETLRATEEAYGDLQGEKGALVTKAQQLEQQVWKTLSLVW